MHDEGVPMVVSFFTRIPLKGDLEADASTVYLLTPLSFGLSIFPFLIFFFLPTILGRVLSILSIYLLWGPMHLEALMDFFDGLGGGYKAMKDPRVGSFGVIAAIFLILIEISSLKPEFYFFALSEMGAKLTMLTILLGKPLGNGLGHFFAERISYGKYALTWILALILGLFFFGAMTLYLLLSIPVALIVYLISLKKFGGVNGDVMGASNEIGRAVMMLCLSLITLL